PMLELSNDQKGKVAPCVPGSTRSVPPRSDRNHSSSPAPKTTALPSGASAGGAPPSPSIRNDAPSGATIEEYVGAPEDSIWGGMSHKARTARSAMAATAQAMSSRRFRDLERANTVPEAGAESGCEID